MKDISKEVFKEIKDKDLKPKPCWQFLARDWLLWILFAVSLIIGSLSFSAMLFIMVNRDWDIYESLGRSLPQHIALSLPYVWIIVLVVFVLVAIYNYRFTKKGYRYKPLLIIISSIILSLFIGAIFFRVGVGAALDRSLARAVPPYQDAFSYRRQIFQNNINDQLIAGRIVDVLNDKEFILEDPLGNEIKVDYSEARLSDVDIEKDEEVGMIGKRVDFDHFKADIIRSFEKGPGFRPRKQFIDRAPENQFRPRIIR